MISKDEYAKNKEYWDYQRLVEYNREIAREELEKMAAINDIDPDTWFEQFWNQIDEDDYQTPPYGWQPKNSDYRIDK